MTRNGAYRLTITRIINKVLFTKAIKCLIPNISLAEVVNIKNQLPYIIDDLDLSHDAIDFYFKDNAKYSYEKYEEYVESPDCICIAPWETKEYTEARNWYLTLSKEDRDRVDILVKGNVPWG